jgi:hypothetical protein
VICSPVGCGVYSSLSPDPASKELAAFLFRSSWIDIHGSLSLLSLACVCSSFGFICGVSLQKLRFLCGFLCESLQGDAGIALESPDQKTRSFLI